MSRSLAGALLGAAVLVGLPAGALSAQAAASHRASSAAVRISPEAAAQAATRRENTRLLGLARLPSGATRDRGPQVPILRQPGQHSATSDLVDRAEFFTLPLSRQAARSYLNSHPPQGLRLMGSGSGGDYDDVLFTDPRTSSRFTDPSLLYTFAAEGGETALRIDAQTIVVHPHTADEQVEPGAGVAVVAATGGYPTRTFRQATLDSRQSHDLAVALNGLPRSSAGGRSCLADTGGRISVTFARSGQVFTLNPACYAIGVLVKGRIRPGYDVSPDVEKLLFHDVGLTYQQLFADASSQSS